MKAYELRISDSSSDVCSSDLFTHQHQPGVDQIVGRVRQVELVDRLVEAGRGVGVGTEGKPLAFEELDHLALGHMGRAVERHMLQEMSQPALVLGLVEADRKSTRLNSSH